MSEELFAEKTQSSLESHAENEEAAKNIPRLHIPRASLSSNSSSKSSSTSRSREFSPPLMTPPMRNMSTEFLSESEPESIFKTSINQLKSLDGHPISRSSKNISPSSRNNQQKYLVRKAAKPSSLHSLSSASSSLSTGGSDQSNYSVNSLLLSVKNLENFNRKSSEAIVQHKKVTSNASDENPNVILKSNYYLNNYFLNQENNQFSLYEHRWKMLQNIKSITALQQVDDDDNERTHRISQDKEADQLSTTSSTTTTNFTVISLNDNADKRLKRSRKAICRRSHTISILIMVMTTIFVIVISIMLFLMDMRNQKMPR